MGPVSRRLQALYFAAVRGEAPPYAGWVRPVYARPLGPTPAPEEATAAITGASAP